MRRSDFHFDLPDDLIAQYPSPDRGASRLLCLDGNSGELADRQFRDLPDLLQAGDLLVFNDTRVIPARLFGRKASGGQVEVLVERVINRLRAWGAETVEQDQGRPEQVVFALPKSLLSAIASGE